MSLVCTHLSFATVAELFDFKSQGLELSPFPEADDEWGIKAHNRPWIAQSGRWQEGQRVIEVGGAFSRLPQWLADTYGVEPWVGDDFGQSTGKTELWTRWGDPHELPSKYPSVTYQFENFGGGSSYRDGSFDCAFSVSTLEHIPVAKRVDVLKDIHRTIAPGGFELHAIDISTLDVRRVLVATVAEQVPVIRHFLAGKISNGIAAWSRILTKSGVDMSRVRVPSSLRLLERATLVEAPEVVYRFYPPNDAPSPYRPAASLLVVIEDQVAK